MVHYFLTLINGGGPICTIQRLKAECDEALSTSVFKINLSRYTMDALSRELVRLRRCEQGARLGRAMQVDSFETRVEDVYGFSA